MVTLTGNGGLTKDPGAAAHELGQGGRNGLGGVQSPRLSVDI